MALARPVSAPVKGGIAGTVLAGILAAIYAVEGGYVNNPHDHGGPTNFGVTERVARENGYLGHMRNFPKHCYGKITVCADQIYTSQYVERPGFTPMLTIEPAVAKELVDTGVNMGPFYASTYFQTSLNVICRAGLSVDGKVGPLTIGAYRTCQLNMGPAKLCVAMLNALDGAQERRYRRIAERNPTQRRFLKGWLRHRINNVDRKECST